MGFLKQLFAPKAEAVGVGVRPPTQLRIFTNNSCQLQCQMCYGHSPTLKANFWTKTRDPMGGIMTLETYQFILEKIPDTLTDITFTGWGEPFLNPDLFEMIRLTHDTLPEARTTVITNGLMLTDRLPELLTAPPTRLIVSINGHSPESFQTMTGQDPGLFNTLIGQVTDLLAHRPPGLSIWVSSLVAVDTVPDLPKLIDWAHRLGVDGLQLQNYLSPDPQQPSPRSLTEREAGLLGYLKAQQHPLPVTFPVLLSAKTPTNRLCSAPYTTLGVDADCNVTGCPMQWIADGKMGKIWDNDYWENDRLEWLRSVFQPKSQQEIPRPCQHCTYNSAP
jgi:MoaA/NifB/PqqE/SkfB family radical SAM enzyme